MTASTVTPEIAEFARDVRAAMADLPDEEVQDLTEGLEADLTESFAEDIRRELPDPVSYAAELRAAAGLPEASKVATRGALDGLAEGLRSSYEDMAVAVRRNQALSDVADFLLSLRPVWWVLRAVITAWLVAMFVGNGGPRGFHGVMWVVLAAFVTISVQWGRGRWGFPGLRGVIVAGNILAVLVVPMLASVGWWGSQSISSYEEVAPSTEGLSLNGAPLDNIYVYDAAGNPLRNVQMFDVDGNPLIPNRDVDSTQVQQTPATLETGATAYNVFPLAITPMIYDDNGELVPDPSPDVDKAAASLNGPFIKVPAVQVPAATTPRNSPQKVAKVNQ